ncbi:Glucosamine/galactosamine-6-phosphate isomerase, partial [Phakopsora pachyrhizi]
YEYSEHSRLSKDLSEYIVQSQEQAISRHQKIVIAISGGSLPKLLTDGLLKNSRVRWESWKVFFANEQVVPLERANSNFASAMDCFLSKAPIKRSQIISVMSLPPKNVDFADMTPMISSIYEAQILDELETNATDPIPRFDLIEPLTVFPSSF